MGPLALCAKQTLSALLSVLDTAKSCRNRVGGLPPASRTLLLGKLGSVWRPPPEPLPCSNGQKQPRRRGQHFTENLSQRKQSGALRRWCLPKQQRTPPRVTDAASGSPSERGHQVPQPGAENRCSPRPGPAGWRAVLPTAVIISS